MTTTVCIWFSLSLIIFLIGILANIRLFHSWCCWHCFSPPNIFTDFPVVFHDIKCGSYTDWKARKNYIDYLWHCMAQGGIDKILVSKLKCILLKSIKNSNLQIWHLFCFECPPVEQVVIKKMSNQVKNWVMFDDFVSIKN